MKHQGSSTGGSITINLHGISKSFGSTEALHKVDLDIQAREVLALVGGNGSGKSTLLKILAGVLRPDEGVFQIDGASTRFTGPRAAKAQGIDIVFQDLALCSGATVLENIYMGREITYCPEWLGLLDFSTMAENARHLFQKLGLPSLPLQALVETLSGGQQKAVAFVRAAIREPRILLLDEPTAALGVKEQDAVLRYIEKLKTSGISVVFVTHDIDEVIRVADRVVVLRRGRLLANFLVGEATKEECVRLISA